MPTSAADLARLCIASGGSLTTRWAHARGEVIALDQSGQVAAVIETFATEIQARLWAARFQPSVLDWSPLRSFAAKAAAVVLVLIFVRALYARSW